MIKPWLIAGIQRFVVPPRLVTGQGSSAGASIINGGGEYVSLAEIFLRKLLRFCLSRLAIGSQNRTPVVKIHAATKKRILLFGRMRAKSLVDIFRQMG